MTNRHCLLGVCVVAGAFATACSSANTAGEPTMGAVRSEAHGPAASHRAIGSLHLPDVVATGSVKRTGTPAPGASMHVTVALPLSDEPGLDALLADLYDPASPRYEQFLTVAEFTDRFGPTAESYRRLADYFRSEGLVVQADAANRVLVGVDGTVADFERVFHVTLGLYPHPTELRTFMAPDREPTLDVSTPVLHVTGLDDYELPQTHLYHEATPRKGTGSGPSGSFLGSDMRAAYYGSGSLTGKGQSLGLMELGGYNQADVDLYFTTYGPPLTATVVPISTDGLAASCTKCEDSEQVLDIEYAISMAPGLTQVQVYVGKNAEDVLGRMASDATSLQLSTSWGWAQKEAATDNPLFKEMAAQGQTFLTASGDYSSLKASGPWPEESAHLTAVGGTDLVAVTAGGAWSSETGWAFSAGGPSLLKTSKIPSYQAPFITPANMGSTTARNVPDISAAARGFYICADGSCSGGSSGTSFSSPIWAGFVALANERAANNGKKPVGFLNPRLYYWAGKPHYSLLFHDVTSGTSGAYSAGPIYDLVTGLGSPTGEPLIRALEGK